MVDFVLYHYPLCPFSRKVRFLLTEFGFSHKLKEVKFWKKDMELMRLNPAHEVPVLIDMENDAVIVDSFVIAEYLDVKYNNSNNLLKFSFLSDNEIENKQNDQKIKKSTEKTEKQSAENKSKQQSNQKAKKPEQKKSDTNKTVDEHSPFFHIMMILSNCCLASAGNGLCAVLLVHPG